MTDPQPAEPMGPEVERVLKALDDTADEERALEVERSALVDTSAIADADGDDVP